MSPVTRLVLRAVIAGVLATCSSLVASMSGSDLSTNEIIIAAISGVVALCTAASLELGTPVNASVGWKKDAEA